MSNDVVDLILADHRRFQELFEQLRGEGQREALTELAQTLVAHAEAEEAEVYPTLRKFADVDNEEVDHGSEEHAEGHRALLDLLQAAESGQEDWKQELEILARSVNHHLSDEERTILRDAREILSTQRLNEMGEAFSSVRRQRLDEGCGRIEYVRDLVARSEGIS